jgi:hypothetical protein
VELVASGSDRVTGARAVNRDTGADTVLNAELVIDAMGRGACTPAFLDNLGYGRQSSAALRHRCDTPASCCASPQE